MIVVDASALTDFLLGRPVAVAAVTGALVGREHEPLAAPELVEPETLNALRRMAAADLISHELADRAVADLTDVRVIRYPHAPLRARVWQLRHILTAYDASYLALAEALDDPLLITGDAGLAAQARQSLGDEAVELIA